ncbi:hypothetical protein A8E95_25555 [Burkholderia cenocepacia]|nr:hypothetical protein A8E96_20260 [Burkholderia cenocepacia]ONW28614.1 hypothetical protein A8E95_25555 [Burkholderia cenocepacia]
MTIRGRMRGRYRVLRESRRPVGDDGLAAGCMSYRHEGFADRTMRLQVPGWRGRAASSCFVERANPGRLSGRSNGTVAANPSQEVTAV